MSKLLKLNGKPMLGHSFSSLQSFLVCLESSHTVNRFKMSQSNVRVFDIEGKKKITLWAVTWKPIIKHDEGDDVPNTTARFKGWKFPKVAMFVGLVFKLKHLCLTFKFDENAAFSQGRSETFSEHRKFPADYSLKNSLEAAVEQKKKWTWAAHWFMRGNVVIHQ